MLGFTVSGSLSPKSSEVILQLQFSYLFGGQQTWQQSAAKSCPRGFITLVQESQESSDDLSSGTEGPVPLKSMLFLAKVSILKWIPSMSARSSVPPSYPKEWIQ